MELMQAHNQWRDRPDDERFLNLNDLHAFTTNERDHSKQVVLSSRRMAFEPTDNNGLIVRGETNTFAPTHWAFGQLAGLAKAPADYLRSIPSAMAADCLNYGFQYARDVSDVGLLLYQNGGPRQVKAATGPNYGRIWNSEVTGTLCKLFGDGVTGRWHVPGEFNIAKPITKESTTLYAGDRDMWCFLADGQNDIEIKNRRFGKSGRLQRGFFIGNSEVGHKPIFLGGFLFDYMCCNHIIWGASGFEEIRIRHTSGAPDRWLEEIMPALESYSNSETASITTAIAAAQQRRIDNVADFLANRFGPRMVGKLQAVHQLEEQKPIETVFDAVTAATALARGMPWVGPRVELEREAGKLLVAA